MSNDLETVEDAKKNSLADDSCAAEVAEIVPVLCSAADQRSQFIDRVFEVKLKQETANVTKDSHFTVKQELAVECETEVPLQSTSDDYAISECIDRVLEVEPKQEPANVSSEDSHFYVKQELAVECDETEVSHFCATIKVSFATKLFFAVAGL